MPARSSADDVVRLKPFQYIHVHDNNSNVTRVVQGPATFTKQDHEQVLTEARACVVVPPRHYVVVVNPVLRDGDGNVLSDKHGQAKVAIGDKEIRFEQEPFPLFPGEELEGRVSLLQVLTQNQALRLRALRDFDDHKAGDEWLVEGPTTYRPRVEVEQVEQVSPITLKPNTGLLLRARNKLVDRTGVERQAGQEWLYVKAGPYLPGVDEEVVDQVRARVLTSRTALALECLRRFTDEFGKQRNPGEQWLVTADDCDTYIPTPNEKVLSEVALTTLTDRQYCVVVDPWVNGKRQLGQKETRKGRTSFFLKPGESLERGIENVILLGEDEAVLLSAKEAFKDEGDAERKPGDKWMLYGPREFVPQTAVEVVERRENIPLTKNQGIYVRNTQTGQVRAVVGETYMLEPAEELWAKPMPEKVLDLLAKQGEHHHSHREGRRSRPQRDPTRVVTYSIPHNSIVQVYDAQSRKSRCVFGPDMVALGPEEQFTVVSLSGDKPKRAGVITSLSVFLGPDFMTDILTVETSDHARLSLQLSYNWVFPIAQNDTEAAAKVFNVPDFVGDACNAIASRIRGAVASESFDTFHKNSTAIIRAAVFGFDHDANAARAELTFKNNGLKITSVDIQGVDPVDQKTRDALQKSVQLAIEITTKSQEAAARQDAEAREQKAKGELERQILTDKADAEREKKQLLALQAESAAIESTGASKAEARANAAAAQIEGECSVNTARQQAKAAKISADAELVAEQSRQATELDHKSEMANLEIDKARQLAQIEVDKFKKSVDAIGQQTIAQMARAGPEMQQQMLGALGLQGYLLTDGNSPINLMNTAQQMISTS